MVLGWAGLRPVHARALCSLSTSMQNESSMKEPHRNHIRPLSPKATAGGNFPSTLAVTFLSEPKRTSAVAAGGKAMGVPGRKIFGDGCNIYRFGCFKPIYHCAIQL